jgi:hypothetical protein
MWDCSRTNSTVTSYCSLPSEGTGSAAGCGGSVAVGGGSCRSRMKAGVVMAVGAIAAAGGTTETKSQADATAAAPTRGLNKVHHSFRVAVETRND